MRVGTKTDIEIAELLVARAKLKGEISVSVAALNVLEGEIKRRRDILKGRANILLRYDLK